MSQMVTDSERPDSAVGAGSSRPRPIVVGYDGSEQAQAALAVAIEIAGWRSGTKVVVTCGRGRPPGWVGYTYRGPVVGQEQAYGELEEQIAKDVEEAAESARKAGVEAVAACTSEHPVDTLLTVAKDSGAAMIVVGARGAGGLHDVVMGSTTMRLLHHSTIPVLVVPSTK